MAHLGIDRDPLRQVPSGADARALAAAQRIVQDHDRGPQATHAHPTGLGARHLDGAIAVLVQDHGHEFAEHRIVLDHEHQRASSRPVDLVLRGIGVVRFLVGRHLIGPHRQREIHRGPVPAALALDADHAAHQLHQALRDRESEPGAAVLAGRAAVALREFLEDDALLDGRDADARIDDLEAHVPQIGARDGAHRDAPLGRELEAVADQVDEHLLGLVEVAAHRGVLGLGLDEHELHVPLRGLHVRDGADLLEQRRDLDLLEIE